MLPRRAAFFLLLVAIVAPLTVESAPAPQPDTEGVIEFVKPPTAMSLEKFRDQQITYLRTKSVHGMVVSARAEIIEVPSDNGFECRYPNWFDFSIVKEQKVVEAFTPKLQFDPKTGRTWTHREPAEKEQQKLEGWLNKNLRIRPAGKGFIRISFVAGSKGDQASIINALLTEYRDFGPHVHREQLLINIKHLRETKLSREQQRLAASEADLPRLKKEVEKDKAKLAWKLKRRERDIELTKESINQFENQIREWQSEVENLPPEPPRIRWAKK
jgi:hypothetical protein